MTLRNNRLEVYKWFKLSEIQNQKNRVKTKLTRCNVSYNLCQNEAHHVNHCPSWILCRWLPTKRKEIHLIFIRFYRVWLKYSLSSSCFGALFSNLSRVGLEEIGLFFRKYFKVITFIHHVFFFNPSSFFLQVWLVV